MPVPYEGQIRVIQYRRRFKDGTKYHVINTWCLIEQWHNGEWVKIEPIYAEDVRYVDTA